MKLSRRSLIQLYLSLLTFIYIFLFYFFQTDVPLPNWVIITYFAGLTAFFDANPIVLPSGKNLTLVTPYFFTISVLYGEVYIFYVTTLMVIFLIITIPKKWIFHICNGLQFSLASVFGLQAFQFFGGIIGTLDLSKPLAYLGFAVVYFIINVGMLVAYLQFNSKITSVSNLHIFLERKNIYLYATVMTLGILMTIVVTYEGLIGLFLFSIVLVGLAISYRYYYKMFDHFRDLSIKDELTGLFNHRYFQNVLKEKINSENKVSLLLLDLDYFKVYNDLFGHPEGDQFLRDFSRLLQTAIPNDAILCRYGGEEFALILPNKDSETALQIAEKLRNIVSSHPFKGKEYMPNKKITVSIGVSTYPEMTESKEQLIKHADQALYKIKYTTRNKVQLYSPLFDEL